MSSNDSANTESPPPASAPAKPNNLVYLLIPTSWRNRIKTFNKNVSTLKFVKSIDTPERLKSFSNVLDSFFQCHERGSSVGVEIACGVINFVSCMFLLAVIPNIMTSAGYDISNSTAVVSILCGVGNIISGIVSNLPIIVGPSTPVTAYFVATVQDSVFTIHQANMVVIYTGIFFFIMGVVPPIGRFCARIIPEYIQISTAIGVGLISTLAGFTQLGLVRQGKYSVLELGSLDARSIIGISTILVIAISVIVKSKVSHIRGLVWGTFIWWISQNSWPSKVASVPKVDTDSWSTAAGSLQVELIFELFFLLLLTVFGLCKSLCVLGNLITKEGMVPNGRYLTTTVALMNILSGSLNCVPVTVIADSAAGVRAGAKTGLSSVVAGILFLLAIFFGPLFASIPPTGYSPILIMTGIVQFKNIQNLDFTSRFIVPAFICFTLIPFTNSIFAGLGIGMTCYIILSILTGQFIIDGKIFLSFYFPEAFGENSSQTDPKVKDHSSHSIAGSVELSNSTHKVEFTANDGPVSTNSSPGSSDEEIAGDCADPILVIKPPREHSRRRSVVAEMVNPEIGCEDVKGFMVGV